HSTAAKLFQNSVVRYSFAYHKLMTTPLIVKGTIILQPTSMDCMKMKLIFLVLTLLASSAMAGNPHPKCFVFTNVNVISMAEKETLTNQIVLVQHGLIRSIEPAPSKSRGGCLQIDGSGKYLIPGLTDMHVHLTSPVDLIPYYANGVTTVFN